jgi:hypothetical protein
MYLLQPTLSDKSRLSIGLPVLAGEKEETLFTGSVATQRQGFFQVAQMDRWRIGVASVAVDDGCDAVAQKMYSELFAANEGLTLSRIWNFVPRINETGREGLENYRAFCRGRSLAYERVYGEGFEQKLPAASAVGSEDGRLTVVFAACPAEPKYFENPEQVAAYRYPAKYGPRAPSFSRAALMPVSPGLYDVFISGTAAVVGHETAAPGDTVGQIAHTLRNLRLISTTCGLGDDLGRKRGGERHFKIYLRHAKDLVRVKTELEHALLGPTDKVTYLRSDICRADLNLEIEATLLGVRHA